jgi:hypothetical protein
MSILFECVRSRGSIGVPCSGRQLFVMLLACIRIQRQTLCEGRTSRGLLLAEALHALGSHIGRLGYACVRVVGVELSIDHKRRCLKLLGSADVEMSVGAMPHRVSAALARLSPCDSIPQVATGSHSAFFALLHANFSQSP